MLNFKSILALLAKLKPVDKEKMRREKLEQLFQVDNQVRCRQTGCLYTVYDVTLGSALMIDARDNVVKANWFTSAGRLRTEIADRWDLVRAATPA